MYSYSDITPYIQKMADVSQKNNAIRPEMYNEHHVFRGLRDMDGNGVVTGLTEISRIKAKEIAPDGTEIPCEGQLYYRGYNVRDLVNGFMRDHRFGFEETVYLLLFSELPDEKQLNTFSRVLGEYRSLPTSFVRDMILKAPGRDMMNVLSRSVLALYAYDDNPDDISIPNVLRQCLQLIAVFPMLAVYGYQSFQHYHLGKSLFIHLPVPGKSTAESLLGILREDGAYTALEASVLDLALVLHAEHGGGNNSTFTTHVVTSSGTDTYSAIAAALGSLKGPRHGGANVKVVGMFDDLRAAVSDPGDEGAVRDYLVRLLNREAFDRAGLIYGMGHAVYSKSDPRADILRVCAGELAAEKGCEEEYALYETVARLAPEVIAEKRKMYKGVSANVDFYSGMIYRMLGLPNELFTPLFAVSRIAGWSAHRIEEIQNAGKIIRPAYISVKPERSYQSLYERTRKPQ
ncbi:MAG: citrate/2-methylcitrate synthase [Clostridia bacterium]|nr:citrate/2-methylcitrate synthase [Clostridia bacterium]